MPSAICLDGDLARIIVFFKILPTAAIYSAVHLMTPNRMRAQMFALLLFVDATIGLIFGPLLIGFFQRFHTSR